MAGETMTIGDILKALPHRFPFLMVDRVEKIAENEIEAVKCVTVNEIHFLGHFPEMPVMPGVLIVEALAQVSGILIFKTTSEAGNKVGFLAGIDSFRFKNPVCPGDVVRLKSKLVRRIKNLYVFEVEARVGEKLAAGGKLSIALVEGET